MLGLVVAASVMLTGAAAGATSSVERVHDRARAAEVCEPMVRDSAVAAAKQSLVSRPKGRWQGARYTCRFDFGSAGALLARVRVYPDVADSTDAFTSRRRAARDPSKLYGIGGDAFEVGDGTLLVARKDNFVLTVDGRGLASSVDPDGVVFSATRAVFDCW